MEPNTSLYNIDQKTVVELKPALEEMKATNLDMKVYCLHVNYNL